MNSKIKIALISGILFILMLNGIYAQSAVLREVAGTVEIKKANSELWEPAIKGQSISGDTTISTGFRSSALIALGDSLLTVRPLTRLTLNELSMSSDTESVQVSLQTGRVRADVKAPAGARTQFTVQSPSATASVRGTIFDFDTLNLSVNEGTVEFSGASNVPVLVDAGRFSYSDERTGRAAPPETVSLTDIKPDVPIAADSITQGETAPGLGLFVPQEPDNSSRIIITIGF